MFKFDSTLKYQEPNKSAVIGSTIDNSSSENAEDVPYLAENEVIYYKRP